MTIGNIYDLNFLLKLTNKLFENHTFDSYLTNQQLIVLNHILKHNELNSEIWPDFMSGNLRLKVKIDQTVEDKANQEQLQTTDGVAGSPKNTHIKKEDDFETNTINDDDEFTRSYDDEDLSKLDLDALKEQIDGAYFVGNLSLKVRYVLSQFGIENNLTDYLEEGIDNTDKVESYGGESPTNANTEDNLFTSTDANEDGEDDDYDFDEDDEPNKEAESNDNATEEVVESDRTFKDSTTQCLTLEITISKNTLATYLNPNDIEEKILENSDKFFHSLENDRETMLKKLKLQRSDQKITTDSDTIDLNGNNSDDNKGSIDDDDDDATIRVPKRQRNRDVTGDDDDEEDDDDESKKDKEGNSPKKLKTLPTGLGIENLSLKHLLSRIQSNKNKLNISDYELKHLLTEVRKNRSKWTSDERIGQEELYEACERVVMELRNYTEHSTPFLNKVSKKDAPNYHLVIKKSMDLNTVLKKLKALQYNSKQEFVDDIMLIWKNCLTYNSDPSHFLRAHAIAMQKKSLQLIPLIPNITIRNRADVERELEELEKDKDYKDNDDKEDAEEEVAGSGRKGLTMGAHKLAKDSSATNNSTNTDTNEETTKVINKMDIEVQKGEGEEKEGEVMPESDQSLSQDKGNDKIIETGTNFSKDDDKHSTPQSHNNTEEETKDQSEKMASESKTEIEEDSKINESSEENAGDKVNSNDSKTEQPQVTTVIEGETEDKGEAEVPADEEEDDEDDDEDEEAQTFVVEKDDDKDDVELSVWKSITANIRADICLKRSEYFKTGQLNSELDALLKDPERMKPFFQLYKEFKDQKELEMFRLKMEQNSIMKNGFGTALVKQEDYSSIGGATNPSENQEGNDAYGKTYEGMDLDSSTLLKEYDTMNYLPEFAYGGQDQQMLDQNEEDAVNRILELGMTKKSALLDNVGKGLTPKVNSNISLIQEIRRICHKISLIRMLQNPYSTQFNKANPGQILNAHQYRYEKVNDDIDIDPISQLHNHDYKHDKNVMWKVMHKNVSKIAMSNGFETTQPTAIDILTEIAGNYLSNLTRSLKIHKETNSVNRMKPEEMLEAVLLENGINKPDDLYSYMESEFEKKTKKLKDVKAKLENFLKDLLRPTLQDLSERNFEDESQSFVTGDFASNLNGEDFFGFRELGLEQEFGILSNSVPISLLSFQFQATDSETKEQVMKLQAEEIKDIVYEKVSKKDLQSDRFSPIVLSLLTQSYEKTKSAIPKINKVVTAEAEKDNDDVTEEEPKTKPLEDNDDLLVMEDDELPVKTKMGSRLRLPPTGKISTTYKKRPLADAFILPEEDPIDEINVNNDSDQVKVEDVPENNGTPMDNDRELDLQISENPLFDSPDIDNNSFGLNLEDNDIAVSNSSLNLKLG